MVHVTVSLAQEVLELLFSTVKKAQNSKLHTRPNQRGGNLAARQRSRMDRHLHQHQIVAPNNEAAKARAATDANIPSPTHAPSLLSPASEKRTRTPSSGGGQQPQEHCRLLRPPSANLPSLCHMSEHREWRPCTSAIECASDQARDSLMSIPETLGGAA